MHSGCSHDIRSNSRLADLRCSLRHLFDAMMPVIVVVVTTRQIDSLHLPLMDGPTC